MGIKKLLTRDTNIIELTEKAPNMFLSRKVDMKKDLLEIWNAWYKYDNEYYYFKKMDDNPNRFVNELIGEKLANRLNLDTVHYEIAKQGYNYGVASKNFKVSTKRSSSK